MDAFTCRLISIYYDGETDDIRIEIPDAMLLLRNFIDASAKDRVMIERIVERKYEKDLEGLPF